MSLAIEKKVSPYSAQQEKGNNGNIANSSNTAKVKAVEGGLERKNTENNVPSKGRIDFYSEHSNIVEEPIKTLDSLFKKTLTKPHIYYLPLTDEEVSFFSLI